MSASLSNGRRRGAKAARARRSPARLAVSRELVGGLLLLLGLGQGAACAQPGNNGVGPAGDFDGMFAGDPPTATGDDDPVVLPPDPIDAAITRDGNKIFFFNGAEYIRYDFTIDSADAAYPRLIADWWPGLFPTDIDAAFSTADKAHFFRDDEYIRYDWPSDAAEAGYPVAIATAWPGLWADGIDAVLRWDNDRLVFIRGDEVAFWDTTAGALEAGSPQQLSGLWSDLTLSPIDAAVSVTSAKNYLFSGDDYLRYAQGSPTVDPGYPRVTRWWWPGLWDPNEGTGHPGERLPASIEALLWSKPDAAEIAARKARVALSAVSPYTDISDSYPQYVASIEERLGAWGCLILRHDDGVTHRFRCATNTRGPFTLDIQPLVIDSIDWRDAAHHSAQVSQGDFAADPGTPVSIFGTDDGLFYIDGIWPNEPTGSISGGLRAMVRFTKDGSEREIQFSHLNDNVPQYALDAANTGTPLPAGTVFGFIGYTGNLWIGAPPAADGPYTGNGSGLPVAHSHVWFKNSQENHERMSPWAREAMDFSGRYPYGGG